MKGIQIQVVISIILICNSLPAIMGDTDEHNNCSQIISNTFNGGSLDESRTNEIYNCLSELGRSPLTEAQSTSIWNSLKMIYNGSEKIPKQCIKRLGWSLNGIPVEDYACIEIDDIEMVEIFGVYRGLNDKKMAAIVDRIRCDWADKEPEDYSQFDLMALNQILCYFKRSDIERIHPDAYKEAAAVIGTVANCSMEILQAFAQLAVQSNAFGKTSTWTKFDVIAIGNVVAGLSQQQFSMISSNLHDYINIKENYNKNLNKNHN